MSLQRHDTRTRAPDKYGKPGVNYPYGDLRFPRIIEQRTAKKLAVNNALAPLTPHRDQASYPGAVLITQTSTPGDDTDQGVTETYEVLPGPWKIREPEIQDTGITSLVASRMIAATADYNTGEFVPAALNVVSVTKTDASGNCVVTVSGNHELPPRAWVTFAGTNSTPSLQGLGVSGGNFRIVSVPAENQMVVTPTATVTVAGTAAGTMQAVHRIVREISPLEENTSVLTMTESMIAVLDVTEFNETVQSYRPYAFPDFLRGVQAFAEDGDTTTLGDTYAISISSSGTYELDIQEGSRTGVPCIRHRLFSSGPPTAASLAAFKPTTIILSRGSVAIKSKTNHFQQTTGAQTTGHSYSTKTGSIPSVMTTGGGSFLPTSNVSGSIRLIASVPTRFIQGDTIWECEQPQKIGAALWQTVAYEMTATYTSGLSPGDFIYVTNPWTVAAGVSSFTANTTSGVSGGSSFAVTPSLPTGFALNSSTGSISSNGATTTTTAGNIYTITCAVSGVTKTAYLILTVA